MESLDTKKRIETLNSCDLAVALGNFLKKHGKSLNEQEKDQARSLCKIVLENH